MIAGLPPFYSKDIDKMYEYIKLSDLKFTTKVEMSEDAKDIITKFLCKDPALRLGSKSGLNEFKNHPFFKTINFETLMQKGIKAPFIPQVENKFDVGNFDNTFTEENPRAETMIDTKKTEMINKYQDKFKEFK